jgi:hypothetical protein
MLFTASNKTEKKKEKRHDINVSPHGNTVKTHPSPSALAVLQRTNNLEQTIHFSIDLEC